MTPAVALCLIGLAICIAIAAYGIHGLKADLPARPEHEPAEDLDLASGAHMNFLRDRGIA